MKKIGFVVLLLAIIAWVVNYLRAEDALDSDAVE